MPAEVSREYEQLKRRNFQPYTVGHQIMYEVPLKLMNRNDRSRGLFSILEAGFGIGWGLERMMAEGVIRRYVGYEPDLESFNYVAQRHGARSGRHDLVNRPFTAPTAQFDHSFCIEVIEHVEPDNHLRFLSDLRAATSDTLWLSTPDLGSSSHGVRTAKEWCDLLRTAGFGQVTSHQEQWTTLFICQ